MSKKLPASDWTYQSHARDIAIEAFPNYSPSQVEFALIDACSDRKIKTQARCRKFFGHGEAVMLDAILWHPSTVVVEWEKDQFATAIHYYPRSDADIATFFDVRFCTDDLMTWINSSPEGPTSTKGRTKGSGTYPGDDALVARAEKMLKDSEAISKLQAATKAVDGNPDDQSTHTNIERIRKKIKWEHPLGK